MLMRTPHRWVWPKRLHPPGFIVPCQPTLASKVPAGDGWIYELKHDGFRVLAFKDGDSVRLWSRNGRDWSAEFVAITEAALALHAGCRALGRFESFASDWTWRSRPPSLCGAAQERWLPVPGSCNGQRPSSSARWTKHRAAHARGVGAGAQV